MNSIPAARGVLFLFFLTVPLNSVENFRITTDLGLIAIPLIVLVTALIVVFPNLPQLFKRSRVPYLFAIAGVLLFVIASTLDILRAFDQLTTLSVVLKRFVGIITLISLLGLLSAKLVSIERLLEVYCISSAIFLTFVAFMSIIVHGLPYVVPDPLYAQVYNKNQVAVLSVFSFVCALYLCLKSFTIVRTVSLIAILVVVFLSYSRASWLVTVVTFSIMVLYDSRRRYRVGALRVLFGCVAAFVFFSLFSLFLLETNLMQNAITSLTSWMHHDAHTGDYKRTAILHLAADEFYSNPIIGIGTGNFYAQYPLQTHNSYVQVLAENGIVIFIALLSFYAFVTFKLFKVSRTPEGALGVGLLTYCLIYMGVMNILEFQLFYIASALIFLCAQRSPREYERANVSIKRRKRVLQTRVSST